MKIATGWTTTSFVQTPPISSYLIALAVGHFASLEKISKSGVLIRVWGWTGMERYAQEGLDVSDPVTLCLFTAALSNQADMRMFLVDRCCDIAHLY